MRLALQTDFALRTLMFLATRGRATRAQIADVARYFQISAHHVAKVVNLLSRLGFVRSVRGAGGGIELLRDPAQIRLGDVVLAFEGNLHLLECVGTDNVCVIQKHCKLKRILGEAERVQFEFLNGVCLSDVLPV